MTVREFGAGDIVRCASTGLTDALANGWSAFGVIKRTAETDYVVLVGIQNNGNHRGGFWLTDTGLLQAVGSGLDTTIPLDVPLNTWCYVGIDVPNGDGVTVRGHLKQLSGGAMSHANSSGTVNEETSATNQVTLGNNDNDFPMTGRVAALGFRKGGTLWNDAQHETNAAGIQEWIDGGATNVWAFQQTGTPPAQLNDSVGDSDQTNQGSDGTTAVAGDDPPNFDLTLGGGATDLVIADAAQAQLADSPTLVQQHMLVIADAAQAQLADSPTLAQVHVLAIADAAQAQLADSPALTQVHTLAIADASQAQAADQVTLNSAATLAIADAAQVQLADSPALTQVHNLTVLDALQAQLADSPTLTQVHTLAIADAVQQQRADNVVLLVGELPRGPRAVMIDGQARYVSLDAQTQRVRVTSQASEVSV
jgi:Ni,Fe-hydrogenase maturation factor